MKFKGLRTTTHTPRSRKICHWKLNRCTYVSQLLAAKYWELKQRPLDSVSNRPTWIFGKAGRSRSLRERAAALWPFRRRWCRCSKRPRGSSTARNRAGLPAPGTRAWPPANANKLFFKEARSIPVARALIQLVKIEIVLFGSWLLKTDPWRKFRFAADAAGASGRRETRSFPLVFFLICETCWNFASFGGNNFRAMYFIRDCKRGCCALAYFFSRRWNRMSANVTGSSSAESQFATLTPCKSQHWPLSKPGTVRLRVFRRALAEYILMIWFFSNRSELRVLNARNWLDTQRVRKVSQQMSEFTKL